MTFVLVEANIVNKWAPVGRSGFEEAVFRGINEVVLDEKGRFTIPLAKRELIGQDGVVVTIDTEDQCLLLYPKLAWEPIELKINALPSYDKEARRCQRLLIGHATELNVDSHGRILIPPVLREYARLNKEIVLVGQGNKFEIWQEGYWTDCKQQWLQQLPIGQEVSTCMKSISL